MKKTLIFMMMIALLPYGLALADRGGGGDRGGDNGGGSGNSGGIDNSNDNVRSSNSSRATRSSGGYRTYYYRGYGYGGNGNYYHRFGSSAQTYNGSYRSNVVSPSLRRMGVSSVPRSLSSQALLSHNMSGSEPGMPSRGPDGRAFSASTVSPSRMSSAGIRNQMAAIANSRGFGAEVNARLTFNGRPGNYYWHSWNGYNYCNYYDRFGNLWWGWYFGGAFFWTQFYWGNWWWYDPWWGNWCWWWNGWWWWEDPATTTVYVYNNGNYTPAQSNGDNGNNNNGSAGYNPEDYGGPVYGTDGKLVQPNSGYSESNPAPRDENGSVDFTSQDGKVKVTVSSQGDAFLYDLKNPKAKPVYLDSNVDEVKFSSAESGPTRILLLFKDGTFETFNEDGTPVGGSKA